MSLKPTPGDTGSSENVSDLNTIVSKSNTPRPSVRFGVTPSGLMTFALPETPGYYSSKYPPRGQAVAGRYAGAIEIVDSRGDRREKLRDLAYRAYAGPDFLHLQRALTTSELSGEPGYTVRLQYVELALTAAEICRLVLHRLSPAEFFALAEKHGVFYEISAKYYNENTGLALDTGTMFVEDAYANIEESMPHLFVLETELMFTPHSINSHAYTLGMVKGYSRLYNLKSFAVPLLSPESRAQLDPLANIVALHLHEDTEMRAYGPFRTIEDAETFIPANGHKSPLRAIRVGLVNSSYFAT